MPYNYGIFCILHMNFAVSELAVPVSSIRIGYAIF